jgi:hypothetical protein
MLSTSLLEFFWFFSYTADTGTAMPSIMKGEFL